MTKLFHAKVEFRALSGKVTDNATQSFSVIQSIEGASPELVGQAISDTYFADFLNAGALGSRPAQYLGQSLDHGVDQVTMKVYGPISAAQIHGVTKGDGSTYLGSPVFTDFGQIGDGNVNDSEYPRQVAVDLVLRATGWQVAPIEVGDGVDADTKVDRPKQRLTGRIKFGPLWDQSGSAQGGEKFKRPTSALTTVLTTAANSWRDALWANPSALQLAVWSRAAGAMVPVTHVEVPNAFSNVIRRKVAPTGRSTTLVA